MNLEIKERLNFNDFYLKQYLKYFKYEQNTQMQRKYPLTFPFFKHFQVIDPSVVNITKPVRNKIKEIFCEALK